MFRSESMGYYHLCLPRESAFSSLSQLGKTDYIHFIDSNSQQPLYSRDYSQRIRQCSELLLKIDILQKHCKKFEVLEFDDDHVNLDESRSQYLDNIENYNDSFDSTKFNEIEITINEMNKNLEGQMKNFININERINYLIEEKSVLEMTKSILEKTTIFLNKDKNELKLEYIIGTINNNEHERLERMVFRITKGNVMIHTEDLILEKDIKENKKYFIIMFSGGIFSSLKTKLEKLCDSFHLNRFEMPISSEQLNAKITENGVSYSESENIKILTNTVINNHLTSLVERNPETNLTLISQYRLFILSHRKLCQILNLFKNEGSLLHGNCFVPLIYEFDLKVKLQKIGLKSDQNVEPQLLTVESLIEPPTYFRASEFRNVFQEIINTYGIPRYKEVNPALFTIISFPFFFGIMFGDIGHGFLLLLFSLYLLFFNDRNLVFLQKGKYLFVFMGFFSLFCGFIYNDFFGFQLNLFGSCYNKIGNSIKVERKEDCVYIFGIDPVWGASKNELTFMNSFKMKLAIIFGIIHMLLGLILKGFNNFRFKCYSDFFLQTIPQILFLLSSFGYLVFLIFFKWMNTDLSIHSSLIQILLEFFLEMGKASKPIYYSDQSIIQHILFAICIMSVIILLIVKPFYDLDLINNLKKKNKGPIKKNSGLFYELDDVETKSLLRLEENSPDKSGDNKDNLELNNVLKYERDEKEESKNVSDIIVHQLIETIEFILGTVSHTASYLRLWALSLAHSQLSQVFFERIIVVFITEENYFGLIVGIFIFENVTFGVLMCMDSLECFLHSLRLHWVEFQSKFYKGDGYKFQPFSLKKEVLEENYLNN